MGSVIQFPAQKKSYREKNEEWAKKCVDSAETLCYYSGEGLRTSYYNKKINYDLYSDILNEQDINRITNPFGLPGPDSPAKMQNYPIMNPRIDVLVGEEMSRPYNWRVKVINSDAISEKEEAMMNAVKNFIVEQIRSESQNEEELRQKIDEFAEFMQFKWQDERERISEWILRHLWEKERLDIKLNKCFKDALIAGEEIGQWDIINGEPVFIRLNPLNVHTVGTGESNRIEDADIIVIDSYYSVGKIIDEYNEYLTEEDIDNIEKGVFRKDVEAGKSTFYDGMTRPTPAISATDIANADNAIDTALLENDVSFGSPYDNDGNIRVLKVYWKSMRKIKKVKFYDEFGNVQYKLMPEEYKVNKDAGETSEDLWISEWWEGHKIGASTASNEGIYVRLQPKPVQIRSIENPSKCHPGIVGTIYQTNDNKSLSLVDRMKPYQYLYNIIQYNLELTIATNWGKIMKLPLHEKPEGWDIEQWLWYARNLKVVPYDAFKEGKKGLATGKLAGNMQVQNPVIDLELGNSIQMYINLLEYIDNQISRITGITRSREGNISYRQSVGNTEREFIQSSQITEYLFKEHEEFKRRVLLTGLEFAKVAWGKRGNKKANFILDDGSIAILNMDVSQIREIDFDITVTSSGKDNLKLSTLKQLAHAALQNQMISLSALVDVINTESFNTAVKKLEIAEEEFRQRQLELIKQKEQEQQKTLILQDKLKDREFEREIEKMKIQSELNLNENVTLEKIRRDYDRDGIPDDQEIEKERIKAMRDIEKIKIQMEDREKQRQFEAREKEKDRETKLKIAEKKNNKK